METNIKTGDFFSLHNSVGNINESDYAKVGLIIEAAKAFERSTYQCVYIIDYFKQGFLYVSNNIARLCGGDAEKIKDFGYRFYIDYVPEHDLKMLLEINDSGFKLFNTIPERYRRQYMQVGRYRQGLQTQYISKDGCEEYSGGSYLCTEPSAYIDGFTQDRSAKRKNRILGNI